MICYIFVPVNIYHEKNKFNNVRDCLSCRSQPETHWLPLKTQTFKNMSQTQIVSFLTKAMVQEEERVVH